ncbi:hypothetical protein CATRI_08900 [Corynebacterium atrinae]|nr:hypothetical protein CATRI_08900 [Corynebacterium atrinae]
MELINHLVTNLLPAFQRAGLKATRRFLDEMGYPA